MSKKMSKCCWKKLDEFNKLCKRLLNAFDFPPRFIDFRTFKRSKIQNSNIRPEILSKVIWISLDWNSIYKTRKIRIKNLLNFVYNHWYSLEHIFESFLTLLDRFKVQNPSDITLKIPKKYSKDIQSAIRLDGTGSKLSKKLKKEN